MRRRASLILSTVLILLPPILSADVPERFEQVIYSIRPFDGVEYGKGTFCREESDTIFLLSGVDNFLSVRKTFVYFWPLTGVWEPDTGLLNHTFNGRLEILNRKGKRIDVLENTEYTYFSKKGRYALAPEWFALSGEAATAELDSVERMFREHQTTLNIQREKRAQVQEALDSLTSVIIELRNKGEESEELVQVAREYQKILAELEKPITPPWEKLYEDPPAPLQNGFVVNLPPGDYRLQFVSDDGSILEGSEKNLRVFGTSRRNLTGIDIKPGIKWNRPVQSAIPGSVIYTDGSTDLYIKPYLQAEVNEYYYNNLVRNGSRGNINQVKLVKTGEPGEYSILVRSDRGRIEEIEEGSYIVRQSEGGSLGFTIVPYEKEVHGGMKPHLSAAHLSILPGEKKIFLEVRAPEGGDQPLPAREIRIVNPNQTSVFTAFSALFPLAVYLVLLILRSKKERKNA